MEMKQVNELDEKVGFSRSLPENPQLNCRRESARAGHFVHGYWTNDPSPLYLLGIQRLFSISIQAKAMLADGERSRIGCMGTVFSVVLLLSPLVRSDPFMPMNTAGSLTAKSTDQRIRRCGPYCQIAARPKTFRHYD
jgi:hypothetical protein